MVAGEVGRTALKFHESLFLVPMFSILKRTAIRSVRTGEELAVKILVDLSRIPVSRIRTRRSGVPFGSEIPPPGMIGYTVEVPVPGFGTTGVVGPVGETGVVGCS